MTAEPPIVSHQDNTENPTCVILAGKALDLLKGDRHRTHGDRYINHRNIATLWQAFLDNRAIKDRPITPEEVALMMVLLKIARTQTGELNFDDYIDICGYGAVAGEIAKRSRDKGVGGTLD